MRPGRQGKVAAKRAQQFAQLPPRLSVTQIARRLGIEYLRARYWSRMLGYAVTSNQPGRRPSLNKVRLAQIRKLPPNLTIIQVARRWKVSYSTAHHWLRLRGYKFYTVYGCQKIRPEQWRNVDWSQWDYLIARSLV